MHGLHTSPRAHAREELRAGAQTPTPTQPYNATWLAPPYRPPSAAGVAGARAATPETPECPPAQPLFRRSTPCPGTPEPQGTDPTPRRKVNPPHPVVRPQRRKPSPHGQGPSMGSGGSKASGPATSPGGEASYPTQGLHPPSTRPRTCTRGKTAAPPEPPPIHHQPGQAHRHPRSAAEAPQLTQEVTDTSSHPRVNSQPPTRPPGR
ncbi:extensin-like [Pygocentrus nattereri]|uniref:extensin-like n=1 Tax=Pygocentrus nattereri TaxID=42514 RepID=UPI001891CFB7|nr:extensin-like [Pygocentrus nattereri]